MKTSRHVTLRGILVYYSAQSSFFFFFRDKTFAITKWLKLAVFCIMHDIKSTYFVLEHFFCIVYLYQ